MTQIEPDHFRTVLGNYPTGVSVVTAIDGDGPAGMVVGTFTSVSLDPPLVAFMPARDSSTWPRIRKTGRFCVNVLATEQQDLCHAFARSGGDKFEQIPWEKTPKGSPRLMDPVAWVDCEIEQIIESGDHFIVVGRVTDMGSDNSGSPLLFLRGVFGAINASAAEQEG